ncbi:MAG: efflux RND transporter periplasmic adaptor subunit [Verrucomicrobiae bacterium]|nr:efflux RND transporter periplasmic adaptor subunit [Verrucomicrobiae bacterium]
MQIINKIKTIYKNLYSKYPKLTVAVSVVVVAFVVYAIFAPKKQNQNAITFEARRGNLDITVVEGGTVEALESQEIRCEVAAGYQGTKILRIVEEGYFVTDDDVKNGKVLVELDSTEMQERLLTQEIQFQSTLAALTEARQSFDIQLNQSKLDIKTSEQNARFAYMDFAKFVGDKLAAEVVEKLGMKERTNADIIDLAKLEGALKPLLAIPSDSSAENQPNNGTELNANSPQPSSPASATGSGNQPGGIERPTRQGTDGATAGEGSRRAGQGRRGPRSDTESGEPGVRGESAGPGFPRGQGFQRGSGQGGGPRSPSSGESSEFRQRREFPANRENPNLASTDQSSRLSAINNPDIPVGAGGGNNGKIESLSIMPSLSTEIFSIVGNPTQDEKIDFSQYAKPELLGDGSAKQQLRKLLDDLQVAQAQLALQETKLQGTERLFKKGFISKTELETEQMTYTNNALRVATAQTALDLFIKYEFPKQAEELLSKYDQTLRALERTKKEAVSKIAQSLAKLRAAEGRYKIEAQQRQDLIDRINKCVIRAQKSGLVIYANDPRGYGINEQIREGATVRERQTILTIPDMRNMAVRVRIHESYIKRVQKGLKAKVQVDAFPEDVLNGEVTKVSVIPDSGSRWMNPDLKVYPTVVSITDEREWLKPGMSAKVEIMVNRLTNVLYIPLQAVTVVGGKQVCFVQGPLSTEMRVIEAGDFNDEFIEVKSGLKEGEKVLLQPPPPESRGKEQESSSEDENGGQANKRVPGETMTLSPDSSSGSVAPTGTGSRGNGAPMPADDSGGGRGMRRGGGGGGGNRGGMR